MIANASFKYRPASKPRDFSALVQSCFVLWFTSLRPVFWPALATSLVTQLPWLPWWWSTRGKFIDDPLMAWIEPDLFRPGWFGGAFAALMALASLLFLLVLLRRQGLMARGLAVTQDAGLGFALHRFPAALLASLSYTVLMLLALTPVGVALLIGFGSDDPMRLLLALLFGLLLSSLPLAWVSVAAAFIYPPILLDGHNGLSAQHMSFRLVRGYWVLSAGLMSLTLFAYLGILGIVGILPLLFTGGLVVMLDGINALMRPGWLVFGQLLTVPLMALLLPLATAGYSVCYEELRLRHAAAINE